MKRLIITTLATAACICQAVSAPIAKDPDIEAAVESRLAKMTLDEKVGQMCELSIET